MSWIHWGSLLSSFGGCRGGLFRTLFLLPFSFRYSFCLEGVFEVYLLLTSPVPVSFPSALMNLVLDTLLISVEVVSVSHLGSWSRSSSPRAPQILHFASGWFLFS